MTAIAAPSLPAGYIRPVLVAGISFYGPTYAGPKREGRVTLSSSGIGNGPTGVRQELRALPPAARHYPRLRACGWHILIRRSRPATPLVIPYRAAPAPDGAGSALLAQASRRRL